MLHLRTSSTLLDRAFALALEDLERNIALFQDGLLEQRQPVFLAGAGYDTPWTRDAAINTWNGAGLLYPVEARNTLLSVLERRDAAVLIGGQYWDAIIWALGAWAYYQFTGDRPFLALALDATRNSLRCLEATEFSAELGLFRGPAVYGDGVAAYPDIYTQTLGGNSSILDWPAANPERIARPGVGLPMHALSTNCLYYRAYGIAQAMADELGAPPDPSWRSQAERLRAACNARFWLPEQGHYRYLVDPFGNCDVYEGLGHAFAILFEVADAEQRRALFRTQPSTPAGLPCLWPPFERYLHADHVGRHSGTVWPPVQAFWAEAAARQGWVDLFAHELWALARHAVRDGQFFELYHPQTGLPYGGLQERAGSGVQLWESLPHQTWSATAFLRMILVGLAGLRVGYDGIAFEPVLPDGLDEVELTGLPLRGGNLDLRLRGRGRHIARAWLDGQPAPPALAPWRGGQHAVEIHLADHETT